MAEATIHLPDMMQRVTLHVTVTGQRRVAIRVWLGSKLILLAARIMGCGIEITTDTKTAP